MPLARILPAGPRGSSEARRENVPIPYSPDGQPSKCGSSLDVQNLSARAELDRHRKRPSASASIGTARAAPFITAPSSLDKTTPARRTAPNVDRQEGW
jgi:hypothetical protein